MIQGYGTLFAEAGEALAAAGASVDLVVLQMGVGAFASSGVRWAISRGIPAVGAEPAGSSCVATSLVAGGPVTIESSRTTMACLDAGTPTTAGWQTLIGGLSASWCWTIRSRTPRRDAWRSWASRRASRGPRERRG